MQHVEEETLPKMDFELYFGSAMAHAWFLRFFQINGRQVFGLGFRLNIGAKLIPACLLVGYHEDFCEPLFFALVVTCLWKLVQQLRPNLLSLLTGGGARSGVFAIVVDTGRLSSRRLGREITIFAGSRWDVLLFGLAFLWSVAVSLFGSFPGNYVGWLHEIAVMMPNAEIALSNRNFTVALKQERRQKDE
jgi:hypothetical protein